MSDLVKVSEPVQIEALVAGSDEPLLHVVFRLADTEFALPASVVVQMEDYAGASAVPGAPAFVAGVVQLRGKVVPVIDLRLRFGLEQAALPGRRVVVGEIGDRRVALLVDSAREVASLRPSKLKTPPKLLEAEGRGFVRSVTQIEGRLVLVLDFAKVIGEEAGE
jgi:purine-binding chemotaxis protein CheW